MGWASGTDVAEPVIAAIKRERMSEPAKKRIYTALLEAFQAADWDCEYECAGICPVFDEVLTDAGCMGEDDDD